jgi:hypothetical protein
LIYQKSTQKPKQEKTYKIDYNLYGISSQKPNHNISIANRSQPSFAPPGQTKMSFGLDQAKTTTGEFPGSLNYTSVIDYALGAMLGSGNYASVKKATHKETGF